LRRFPIPLSLFEWESIGVRVWQHCRETNLPVFQLYNIGVVGALNHLNQGSPEMSETVELTSTNNQVLAPSSSGQALVTLHSRKVVGQSAATNTIVPYVYMYRSGLAAAGRPAGIFLLGRNGKTGNGRL
jgi:hypothetical protein